MPKKESRSEISENKTPSMLDLQQNLKRRTFLAICAIILIFAILVFLAEQVTSSNTCNIVLSQQRYTCLSSAAQKSGNYSFCTRIDSSSARSACIVSLAQKQNNASICGISNSSGATYVQCVESIAYATKNQNICNKLNANNQSVCMYTLAKNGNFSYLNACGSIPNQTYKSLCSSEFYYHSALRTGNYSYCGMLTNSSNNTILTELTAQNTFSSYSVGPYSYLNASPRDYCYVALANQTSKTSCTKISNATIKASCTSSPRTLNLTAQNVTTLCANSPTNLQGICAFSIYTTQALIYNNESKCSLITNTTLHNSCVVNLATQYRQNSYCNDIVNLSLRSACIYQVSSRNSSK